MNKIHWFTWWWRQKTLLFSNKILQPISLKSKTRPSAHVIHRALFDDFEWLNTVTCREIVSFTHSPSDSICLLVELEIWQTKLSAGIPRISVLKQREKNNIQINKQNFWTDFFSSNRVFKFVFDSHWTSPLLPKYWIVIFEIPPHKAQKTIAIIDVKIRINVIGNW